MLDLVKQETERIESRFLDPACKSGVFLREIAKRLDLGLESKIPNRQKPIDPMHRN
jgi:site-specific DNA-methyltransferase (adenine-specific)